MTQLRERSSISLPTRRPRIYRRRMTSLLGGQECRERVQRLQSLLTEMGAVAAVLSSEANFIYFTGLRFDPLWSSATRSLIAVVPADGVMTLILPGFISEEAASQCSDAVVISYQVPPESVVVHLLNALSELPVGPVGFEMGVESRIGFTVAEWQLIEAQQDGNIVDVQASVWSLRLRKSQSELDALRGAAVAAAEGFARAFAGPLNGLSEAEIAGALAVGAIGGGGDRVGWIGLTSGRGSYGRFVSAPRSRRVEHGDMVWADVGVQLRGYWTDYCRAAVVGPISDERAFLQEAVVTATQAGIDLVRPGVSVAQIARTVREHAADSGTPLIGYGRLGHGIGLGATEPPSIAEWDETVLAPGMVITIEPALKHASGLYCTEQVVAVTEDGHEVLSTAPTGLIEV